MHELLLPYKGEMKRKTQYYNLVKGDIVWLSTIIRNEKEYDNRCFSVGNWNIDPNLKYMVKEYFENNPIACVCYFLLNEYLTIDIGNYKHVVFNNKPAYDASIIFIPQIKGLWTVFLNNKRLKVRNA